jgi:hypothetical protein
MQPHEPTLAEVLSQLDSDTQDTLHMALVAAIEYLVGGRRREVNRWSPMWRQRFEALKPQVPLSQRRPSRPAGVSMSELAVGREEEVKP